MPNVDSGMAIVASLGINVLGNAGMPARMPGIAWNAGMPECQECWKNARIIEMYCAVLRPFPLPSSSIFDLSIICINTT